MLRKGKPARTGPASGPDPEALALAAFGRIAAEPERLERFLALSGLAPDTIRAASAEPGFLGAVLDHVAADETLLLAVSAEIGTDPPDLMAARRRLSPEAEWEP